MTEDWLRKKIFFSIAGALLGSVTPNLRGVAADWDNEKIRIVCYFRGPFSNEDKETMSIVETEVASDVLDIMPVELETVRLDMPAKVNGMKAWVFERKET